MIAAIKPTSCVTEPGIYVVIDHRDFYLISGRESSVGTWKALAEVCRVLSKYTAVQSMKLEYYSGCESGMIVTRTERIY